MQNVDLNLMEFKNGNSMLFKFSNTYNGDPCFKMLCENIWKFSISNSFDEESHLPYFICDVVISNIDKNNAVDAFQYLGYGFGGIPKSDKYTLVCMDGRDFCIELICKSITINKMDEHYEEKNINY